MEMNSPFVSDFEMIEDFSNIPSSSAAWPFERFPMSDIEIMELLWQNGQVVMQTQNHLPPSNTADQFMQEEEMNSLLHNFYDEPAQLSTGYGMEFPPLSMMTGWPLVQPTRETEPNSFGVFSSHHAQRDQSGLAPDYSTVSELPTTVADASNGGFACRIMSGGGLAATLNDNDGGLMKMFTREIQPEIQPMANFEAPNPKGMEPDDSTAYKCHNKDIEFKFTGAKKQSRGSTPAKRNRAAAVHNLSERKRRDRINEKMRILQDLIPWCSKGDKGSTLDVAIQYLTSLKELVQCMSTGSSTTTTMPVMFSAAQQSMPTMGMGLGLGTGTDMETTMNPPLPYLNMLAGSTFPSPGEAAQPGQTFPFQVFNMVHVPNPDQSGIQLANQMLHNINQTRELPSFDGYQHFLGPQQMHVPAAAVSQLFQQNQPAAPPGSHNQHISQGFESIDNNKSWNPTMDPR